MANEEVLGPRKTMFVLVIVVGCFAVLWPRILSPLVLGPSREQLKSNQLDREAGCCEVIFENELAILELLNEVCSTAVHVDGKLSPMAAAECRKAVNETCGLDIAAFLKRSDNVGKTSKKLVETMKNSNSSCLKEHFGVPMWSLGSHLAYNSWTQQDTLKQERPIRAGPHPALRERGRAIPAGTPAPTRGPMVMPPHARVRSSPLSVYFELDIKPPPIPGMRPPLGSPGGPVPTPKSSMGFVMPIYTICIIIFFVYTLSKILFKRTGTTPYETVTPDPQFRRRVFRDDSRTSPDKLVVTAISGLVAEVQQQMEATYAQSQQRQDVQDNHARPYTNGTILHNSGPVHIVASEYREPSKEMSPELQAEKEPSPVPEEPEKVAEIIESESKLEEVTEIESIIDATDNLLESEEITAENIETGPVSDIENTLGEPQSPEPRVEKEPSPVAEEPEKVAGVIESEPKQEEVTEIESIIDASNNLLESEETTAEHIESGPVSDNEKALESVEKNIDNINTAPITDIVEALLESEKQSTEDIQPAPISETVTVLAEPKEQTTENVESEPITEIIEALVESNEISEMIEAAPVNETVEVLAEAKDQTIDNNKVEPVSETVESLVEIEKETTENNEVEPIIETADVLAEPKEKISDNIEIEIQPAEPDQELKTELEIKEIEAELEAAVEDVIPTAEEPKEETTKIEKKVQESKEPVEEKELLETEDVKDVEPKVEELKESTPVEDDETLDNEKDIVEEELIQLDSSADEKEPSPEPEIIEANNKEELFKLNDDIKIVKTEDLSKLTQEFLKEELKSSDESKEGKQSTPELLEEAIKDEDKDEEPENASVKHEAEEVKSIFLETEIPQKSRVLVDFEDKPDAPAPAKHSPMVVSGKMTLSLIQDAPRDTPERDPESTVDDFTTASGVTQNAAEKGEELSDEEIEEEIEIEEEEVEEVEEEEEEEVESDAEVKKGVTKSQPGKTE